MASGQSGLRRAQSLTVPTIDAHGYQQIFHALSKIPQRRCNTFVEFFVIVGMIALA